MNNTIFSHKVAQTWARDIRDENRVIQYKLYNFVYFIENQNFIHIGNNYNCRDTIVIHI